MSDKFLRNEKQQLLNSIGSELSWGWSPAVDFVRLLDEKRSGGEEGHPAEEEKEKRATKTCTTGVQATETANDVATHEQVADTDNNNSDDIDAMIRALERKKPVRAEAATPSGPTESVSVLMAGASDIRHILRTVASLRACEGKSEGNGAGSCPSSPASSSSSSLEYNFYIYEPNLRTHCRHLFFLQWLVDSMFAFEELEERVLMFLEVFGNSLVREMTAAQTRNVAGRLLKGIEKVSGNLSPLLDFGEMKMKEKDFIEEQLTHWVRDSSQATIEAQWSQRVRQDMADRYDNRDNLIDWDFVFHLTEYSSLLKFPEYRTWRNTGVAYDVCHINPRKGFTYSYNTPNKTLCHFDRHGRGLYCGDVKNGPFMALGATTENAHIRQRTADGTCKYGNGVVAMHNVRAWLFTLMTGEAWPWADHAFAWDDPSNYNYLPPGTPSGVAYQARFPRVRFHFVGLDFDRFLTRLADRPDGRRMDAAFVGTSCTHLLSPEFFRTAMARDGVVVAETAKFVVDAEDAAKVAFAQKIESLAAAADWCVDSYLTASLHAGQPGLPKREGVLTDAQKQSQQRYELPFQLALTHQ